MGTNDRAAKPNRNTTTPPAQTSKYAAAMGRKANKGSVSWSQVSGPAIKDAIGFVTAAGDAITFGRTTDGGALSITVLSGNDRLKDYASSAQEAEELLVRIIEASGN